MNNEDKGQIVLFQTEDGQTKLEVQLQDETVWLTIDQMAELFQRNRSTISRHIKRIYDDGKLSKETTCAKFACVVNRGIRGMVDDELDFYNLDMIISVGYRVHSHRGVQFRMWATAVLKEYLKKGFVLNDELLKRAGEVDTLNRIVNLYLEFAELQAKAHIPMYMKDWVQKLDDFLRLSNRELLTHAGKISAEIAKRKADAEYDKFCERTKYELSPVEIHFIDQFEAEQKRLKDNGKK